MLENARLAFKYLRQFPDILPLVGVQAVEEIEEIVAVMEGPAAITVAEQADIRKLQEEMDTRYCRSCDYCQPCQQQIHFILMRLRSHAKRFPADRFYGGWGKSLMAKAEQCADCGECESRCPYDLPIREMMRENVIWYNEQMALKQRH